MEIGTHAFNPKREQKKKDFPKQESSKTYNLKKGVRLYNLYIDNSI